MSSATAPAGFGRPAWGALRHGQQMHGIGLVPVTMTFLGANATFQRALFASGAAAGFGKVKVEKALITADTEITADATNYWTFQVRNVGDDGTATDDLSANGLDTINANVDDYVQSTIPIEGPENSSPKKVFMGDNETLVLRAVKAASAPNLSAIYLTVTLYLRISPPNR
jgi:hypothetical protein